MLLERLHEGWCGSNLLTNINSLTCILSLIPHAHSFRHVWFHLQIASVISIQTMYGHSAYNLDSVVGSAKKDRYCNSIVLFPLSAVTWRSFDANSFLGTAKKSAVCKNIGINGGLNSNHSEVLHLVTIGMSHILQSPHLLVHVCFTYNWVCGVSTCDWKMELATIAGIGGGIKALSSWGTAVVWVLHHPLFRTPSAAVFLVWLNTRFSALLPFPWPWFN